MMSIRTRQVRERIVRPVLQSLDLWSQAAENLMMGTYAVESGCGQYIVQVGGGPALGYWQMEPATYSDCWENFLAYRPALAAKVEKWSAMGTVEEMIWNAGYACAMARIKYLRDPQPLPAADDTAAIAAVWKRVYNSPKGAGSIAAFLAAYEAVR